MHYTMLSKDLIFRLFVSSVTQIKNAAVVFYHKGVKAEDLRHSRCYLPKQWKTFKFNNAIWTTGGFAFKLKDVDSEISKTFWQLETTKSFWWLCFQRKQLTIENSSYLKELTFSENVFWISRFLHIFIGKKNWFYEVRK